MEGSSIHALKSGSTEIYRFRNNESSIFIVKKKRKKETSIFDKIRRKTKAKKTFSTKIGMKLIAKIPPLWSGNQFVSLNPIPAKRRNRGAGTLRNQQENGSRSTIGSHRVRTWAGPKVPVPLMEAIRELSDGRGGARSCRLRSIWIKKTGGMRDNSKLPFVPQSRKGHFR